jgi:hypothetical protein
MDSLWSVDIRPGLLSPLDILETQAFALRDQTDGLLAAEVRTTRDHSEGTVCLLMEIFAPGLDHVRQRVLTARHAPDRIYPCSLDAEGLQSAELAHSDSEFQELVRQILNSGQVKAVALSLIARARERQKAESLPPLQRRHVGHRRQFRPAWAGVEHEGEDGNGAFDALYDERAAGD